jgi:hypothetical protein
VSEGFQNLCEEDEDLISHVPKNFRKSFRLLNSTPGFNKDFSDDGFESKLEQVMSKIYESRSSKLSKLLEIDSRFRKDLI